MENTIRYSRGHLSPFSTSRQSHHSAKQRSQNLGYVNMHSGSAKYATFLQSFVGVTKELQVVNVDSLSLYLSDAESRIPNVISLQEPHELTQREFDELVKSWRADTSHLSSVSTICTHWAYQTIMAAGKSVLPMIFLELSKEADHWFYALRFIVRKDVADGTSTMNDAQAAWLKWAKENSYI